MAPRMTRLVVGVLAGVLLFATPAWGASPGPEAQRVIAAAAAEGLPTGALAQKASEGVAKGIPDERVAGLLAARLHALREAHAAAPSAPPAFLEAAALAVSAGATPTTIVALNALPAEVEAQGASTLADLLRLGVGESVALRLVVAAAGADTAAVDLPGVVIATQALARGPGGAPGAAGRVLDTMNQGHPPLSAVSEDRGGPPPHANAGGCGHGNGGANCGNNGNNGNGGGRP